MGYEALSEPPAPAKEAEYRALVNALSLGNRFVGAGSRLLVSLYVISSSLLW